jgi:exopolysaccharide biosynthesis polyprenyl glycosylphosphotransferase
MTVLEYSAVILVYVFAVKAYPLIRSGEMLDEILHLGLLPIVLAGFAASRSLFARKADIQRQTLLVQFSAIFQELLLTASVIMFAVFLLKLDAVSRAVIIVFFATAFVTLIFVRWMVILRYTTHESDAVDNSLKVLVIGSGRRAHMLADQLQRSSVWGIHIIGFLDPRGESAGRRSTDEILGHVDQISQVLRDNVVEDVVVAVPRSMLSDIQAIIDACGEEGVRLNFMADLYDFHAQRIRLDLVNDIPLLGFEPVAREENLLVAKRIFDILATLIALPVLLPVFLVTAICIKLESPGPVLFIQERIGLHKRRFKMYKFRSMVVDAEARIREIEHLNEADGPNFKIKNDPRMTRIGSFIRKTSIDELPQFFNVLLGDMSLVGPRPMSIRDVALFDRGLQRKRFSVKPGLTCLWQISGRSDLSFDDWLRLDLEYIQTWSFWLDIRILFNTVFVVLSGRGAS